jgi:MFS family permease
MAASISNYVGLIADGHLFGPFRVLARSHRLRRVLAAFLIFSSAELATWVAILVWAYDVGGAGAAGLMAVAQLIPATLIAPVISQLGDRVARNQALGLGFGFQAIGFGLTAAALILEASTVLVYACAVLAAIGVTLSRPVHYALLPDISETPEQLTAANSLSSSVEGFGVFAGPIGAALLLGVGGPGYVYAAAALATAVAAAITYRLSLSDPTHPIIERHRVVEAAVEGFRSVRESPAARQLTVTFAAQFIRFGALDILTVVLALELLAMGPSGPGVLAAALGVGGLLGAGGTVVLIGRRRMGPAIAGGVILSGLPLVLLGVLPSSSVLALVLLVVTGAGTPLVDVAGRTLLQRVTSRRVLTRVFGLQEALLMAGTAAGAALAPALVRFLGGRGAFVAMGFLLVAIGVMQWFPMRRLDENALLPGPAYELLLELPLFAVLEQPVIESLSREMARSVVTSGQIVITEGERGDRFYLVETGVVSVAKGGVEVNRLGAGDYFGETALLRDIPRTATVTAVTDLTLWALEREPFLEAVTGSPLSSDEADRVVQARINDSERRREDLRD